MFSNNYEKARNKIEQDRKKRIDTLYCCPPIIIGPTGPQGENGLDGVSDTINIRNTTTSEAGTNAEVIDISGSPNHILDFVIPRGFDGIDGEIGPTGPQGEKGLDGMSDTITIRNTTTGEAGVDAEVIDISGSPNHILDFVIPKGRDGIDGEMGPTGPTGPTGEISSNCYGMAHSTINRAINNNAYIPFNMSDRVSNMMIAQSGTITLPLEGTYLINWWATISTLDTTPVIINIELQEISPNPRILGWSTSGKTVDDTEIVVLSGTAVIDSGCVEATRNFALVNVSNAEIFLNPNNEVGAVITITKIN